MSTPAAVPLLDASIDPPRSHDYPLSRWEMIDILPSIPEVDEARSGDKHASSLPNVKHPATERHVRSPLRDPPRTRGHAVGEPPPGVLLPAMDIKIDSLRVRHNNVDYHAEFTGENLNSKLRRRIVVQEDPDPVKLEEFGRSKLVDYMDSLKGTKKPFGEKRDRQSAFHDLQCNGGPGSCKEPSFAKPITDIDGIFYGITIETPEFIVLRRDVRWDERGCLSLRGDSARALLAQFILRIPSTHGKLHRILEVLTPTYSSGSCSGPIVDRGGNVLILDTHIKLVRWFWVVEPHWASNKMRICYGKTADMHDARAYYDRTHSIDWFFHQKEGKDTLASLLKVSDGQELSNEEREQYCMTLGVPSIRPGLEDLHKASIEAIKTERKRFKKALPPSQLCDQANIFVGPDAPQRVRERIASGYDFEDPSLKERPKMWKLLWKMLSSSGRQLAKRRREQKMAGGASPPDLWKNQGTYWIKNYPEYFNQRWIYYTPDHQSKPPRGWNPPSEWRAEEGKQYGQRKAGDVVGWDIPKQKALKKKVVPVPLSRTSRRLTEMPTVSSPLPDDNSPVLPQASHVDLTIQPDSNEPQVGEGRASAQSSAGQSVRRIDDKVISSLSRPMESTPLPYQRNAAPRARDSRQTSATDLPLHDDSDEKKRCSTSTVETNLTKFSTNPFEDRATPNTSARPSTESTLERNAELRITPGALGNLNSDFVKSRGCLSIIHSEGALSFSPHDLSRHTSHCRSDEQHTLESAVQQSDSEHPVAAKRNFFGRLSPTGKSGSADTAERASKRKISLKPLAFFSK